MCAYITLVVPAVDVEKLDAFMRRYGRGAALTSNASVAKHLQPDERQFLIAGKVCDCGTILAHPGPSSSELDAAHEKERERLARKGWSDSKIDRAIADRDQSRAHQPKPPEDIAYWASLVDGLWRDMHLQRVGLLVHDYSGDLREEELDMTREDVRVQGAPNAHLSALRPDTLLVMRRPG